MMGSRERLSRSAQRNSRRALLRALSRDWAPWWLGSIGPIGLIGPIRSGLFFASLPVFQPGAGHVLAEAAFLKEIFFQATDLQV